MKLDDPDNLESVQAALSPPDATGKPQPISAAIDDIVAGDQTQQIREVTGAVKILLAVIAVLLAIASLFLVGNTIRLSIYARRREVEVMQLVGATDWFIRWPFVIEGLVVGLFGAGIAVGILFLGKVTIVDPLSDNFALVENLNTIAFGPLIAALVVGAMAVAALGSGVRCAGSCAFEDQRKGLALGVLVGAVIVLALLALVEPLRDLLPGDEPTRSEEALEQIEDSYFREVDEDELQDASINGMVREI